jgi:serine/threonine-protein kinase
VALDLDVPVGDGQWSPDGEWYVVRAGGTTQRTDIWGFRHGVDSVAARLLESAHELLMPRISRNGRWLVYTSDESGTSEVYVRPFPNVDDGRWQISSDRGTEPMWAHSGRELFYINGTGELVAVQVETTEAGFGIGEREVLFQTEGWRRTGFRRHYNDVAPDGQRFIMIRVLGTARTTGVILVENFFEELKAKVGN